MTGVLPVDLHVLRRDPSLRPTCNLCCDDDSCLPQESSNYLETRLSIVFACHERAQTRFNELTMSAFLDSDALFP